MRIRASLAGAAIGVCAILGTAKAQTPGYTLPEANLRAGPGRDYPLINLVPRGEPIEVFGCLGGYGWCDVQVAGLRGWLSGAKLQVVYHRRRVGLAYYAPRLALPIITFDLGNYWGEYYRERPFFADRDRWVQPGYRGPADGYGNRDRERDDQYRRPDEGRPNDDRPGNDQRGNDRGYGGHDDTRRDEARPPSYQPPPTHYRPEQNRPDQSRPDQSRPDQYRPATPSPQATPPLQPAERDHRDSHMTPSTPPPPPQQQRPSEPRPSPAKADEHDHHRPNNGQPPPQ